MLDVVREERMKRTLGRKKQRGKESSAEGKCKKSGERNVVLVV